jgi:predicted adenine nucleotide alpha hydrolase (AANH) superfamily ATPase
MRIRSVLLHVCCGPCGLMPVRMLRAEGFAVTGVFYNPNIHPLREYLLRRAALLEAADRLELPLLWPDPEQAAWNLPQWLRAVPANADKNMRCRACYALRLAHVARWAGDFDFFTSSLLYSRRQAHASIAEEGEKAAQRVGTAFLYRDFRPTWQEGIRLSKAWGLYRQQYCACVYSETERYGKEWASACAETPLMASRMRRVVCLPISQHTPVDGQER